MVPHVEVKDSRVFEKKTGASPDEDGERSQVKLLLIDTSWQKSVFPRKIQEQV